MGEKMTYANVGVNYDNIDPFKRMAQIAGQETATNIGRFGFNEVKMSRGESVYLIETPDSFLAHVEEGLGTKNLVADAMYKLTGKSYYNHIAQDTVAMIVNDMITLGAFPLSVAMHLAVGSSNWFDDQARCRDLINGWKNACNLARCVWGGGETPTLKDIIIPETCVLAGSAMGVITPKKHIINGNIQDGDVIVLIDSSGIHANGLTVARKIAEKLPQGYLTVLSNGRTYGETLLDPTLIYVPIIRDCINCGIDIHYAVNITGHGWRKLMRANQSFAYIIERLPPQLPIFNFLQEYGPMDDREAYGNLNMGAGFALYISEADKKKLWEIFRSYGHTELFSATHAGYIEKSEEKRVLIKPKSLEYLGSTLKVR